MLSGKRNIAAKFRGVQIVQPFLAEMGSPSHIPWPCYLILAVVSMFLLFLLFIFGWFWIRTIQKISTSFLVSLNPQMPSSPFVPVILPSNWLGDYCIINWLSCFSHCPMIVHSDTFSIWTNYGTFNSSPFQMANYRIFVKAPRYCMICSQQLSD